MRATLRRAFCHLFAILLLASALACRADATWRPLFTNPQNGSYRFHCGFFFDEHSGFIAADGRQGVFKTVDGGVTWALVPLTPVPTTTGITGTDITDIQMTSRTHGWLTLEGAVAGLYETSDGGASWVATSYMGQGACVYQTSMAVVVTNRYPGGGAVSTDGGKTFSHLRVLDSTNGVAFVDDQHGVVTGFFDTLWSRTTDGGQTWQKIYSTYHPEAWGIYGAPGTATFYAAGENAWDRGLPYHVLSWASRSTDFGATWIKLSNLPIRTTGHIGGVADTALYIQTATDDDDTLSTKPRPMYRSTDHGRTWVPVGGPSRVSDTRFIVLGCRGEVVIAFDDQGKVWKTTDGGNGDFAQTSLASSSTLVVDSIDVCSPRDTVITIANLGCDTIFITNASAPAMPQLVILDPSGAAPHYPDTIPPHQTGSLRIRLYSGFAGAYQTRLIIELRREGVFSYDTVQIVSAMRFTNPITASAKLFRFDSTALCDTRDTSITLSNDSCFTVQIVSSSIKSGTNFSLVTVINNDSIPSGTKKTFTVQFDPTQLGVDRDSLIVNLLILGKPARMAYPLTGTGVPDNPMFVMSLGNTIDFGTKTTCTPDSIVAFTITNPGCTYLHIQLSLLDSTKTLPPPSNLFKWFVPGGLRKIHKGDTLIAGIEILPVQRGTYTGFLKVIDSIDGHPSVTTYVPYSVTITNGPKVLALDDTHRDLDTIAFCDQKDVTIPFVNNGCDTIFFDSLKLAGAGFTLINPPAIPYTLLPGKSGSLLVRYVPTASGPSSATLTVGTDADSAKLRTIPFTGFATPTDTIVFRAVASRPNVTPISACRPGDTSLISITSTSTYHKKGVHSLDVTLEYNGDVMYPYGAALSDVPNAIPSSDVPVPIGPRLVQLHFKLMGVDLPLDSGQMIIGQQFIFYVSDSAETGFHISSFTFNSGDYIFSRCALGEVSDTGTIALNFVCGDSLLYRFMRYGTGFSITDGIQRSPDVPRPNPVSTGEIAIPFRALRAVGVQLSLLNETGQEILSTGAQIPQAGMASFSIQATPLASGVYHYMIRPLDGGRGVVSGEFVVMK